MKKIKSAFMGALALGAMALGAGSSSAQQQPTFVVSPGWGIATMSFNSEGDLLLGRYGGAHPQNNTASILTSGETTLSLIIDNSSGKFALFLNDGQIITSSTNAINIRSYNRSVKTVGAANLLSAITDPGTGNWLRTVNSTGDIFSVGMTSQNQTQILRTTPSGSTSLIASVNFTSFPESITADSAGNVYIGFRDGSIAKYNSSGTEQFIITPTSNENPIKGLAVDNNDNIYASITNENKIIKLSANTYTPHDLLSVSAPGPLNINNNTLYYVESVNTPSIYKVSVNTPAPVPTMSEWAMIILAISLAGGATLYLQRRRLTA